MKIILIHNQPEVYEPLRRFLENGRHAVLSEKSANKSITTISSDPEIDLVVCDFDVPEQGGLYLLDYLKSEPRFEVLPVVITGTSMQKEAAEICLKLGAYDVIGLPVREEVFLTTVNKAIAERKRTILLVAADPAIVDSLGGILEIQGFRILIAGHGAGALKILAGERVDLVVSDLTLPGMPGLEFLINAKATRRGVPVILLTEPGNRIKSKLAAAGADALVEKPLLKTRMVFAIEQALAHDPASPETVHQQRSAPGQEET